MTDNDAPRMRVDYESGEKVYLQIARAIRDRIISGELPVGAQIPSGSQMKQEWGVNRLTGAQAVEELRKAGLVVTRPGVGTFVAAMPASQVVVLRPGDRVIARMIPSVRLRSPRSTAACASPARLPMPGIIDMTCPSGPIFCICCIESSMSSRVNDPFRIFSSSLAADSEKLGFWA